MSETQIQQACEVATVDSVPEEQNNLHSEVQLQQQTEAQKEQTITELEKRLVQEAVNAIEETKNAIMFSLFREEIQYSQPQLLRR